MGCASRSHVTIGDSVHAIGENVQYYCLHICRAHADRFMVMGNKACSRSITVSILESLGATFDIIPIYCNTVASRSPPNVFLSSVNYPFSTFYNPSYTQHLSNPFATSSVEIF